MKAFTEPLGWSNHALDKCIEEGINPETVREALREPHDQEVQNGPWIEARMSHSVKVDGVALRVIIGRDNVAIENGHWTVITVIPVRDESPEALQARMAKLKEMKVAAPMPNGGGPRVTGSDILRETPKNLMERIKNLRVEAETEATRLQKKALELRAEADRLDDEATGLVGSLPAVEREVRPLQSS